MINRITKERQLVPPSQLKLHPTVKRLYTFLMISALAAAILSLGGMIYPIQVNENWEVLSGWRRKLAAEELHWEFVPIQIIHGLPPEDEEEFIINSNLHREKTYREKYHEAVALEHIHIKKQGKRTDLTDEEKMNTRKEIADELNISEAEVQKLFTIGGHDEELFDTINDVDTHITTVAKKVKSIIDGDALHPNIIAVENISLDIVPCSTCHAFPTTRIDLINGELHFSNPKN